MPLAPPVGVVIANHNNCAVVDKAIDSVVRQTVRDLRVVVVVDASTDSSGDVIRRCLARPGDTRFRYVKLGTNLGQEVEGPVLLMHRQDEIPRLRRPSGDFAPDDE